METLLGGRPPGFFRFISFSAALHVVVVALAILVVRGEPERVFVSQTFAPIELVLPPPPRIKAAEEPAPAEEPKVAETPKPAATEAAPKAAAKPAAAKTPAAPPVVKNSVALKQAPPAVEQKISVEDAIARLEKKARVDEDKKDLDAKIEEIARKKERDLKRSEREIAELKRELAQGKQAKRVVTIDATTSKLAFSKSSQGYASDVEFRQYYGVIASRVEAAWIYAGEDLDRLDAIVSIKINKSGALMDYWIEKSSGDRAFDDSAIKAVKKSAPFPPLPAGFKDESLELGMRF